MQTEACWFKANHLFRRRRCLVNKIRSKRMYRSPLSIEHDVQLRRSFSFLILIGINPRAAQQLIEWIYLHVWTNDECWWSEVTQYRSFKQIYTQPIMYKYLFHTHTQMTLWRNKLIFRQRKRNNPFADWEIFEIVFRNESNWWGWISLPDWLMDRVDLGELLVQYNFVSTKLWSSCL